MQMKTNTRNYLELENSHKISDQTPSDFVLSKMTEIVISYKVRKPIIIIS